MNNPSYRTVTSLDVPAFEFLIANKLLVWVVVPGGFINYGQLYSCNIYIIPNAYRTQGTFGRVRSQLNFLWSKEMVRFIFGHVLSNFQKEQTIPVTNVHGKNFASLFFEDSENKTYIQSLNPNNLNNLKAYSRDFQKIVAKLEIHRSWPEPTESTSSNNFISFGSMKNCFLNLRFHLR